jgi:flagellar biosynthesis component FlhA
MMLLTLPIPNAMMDLFFSHRISLSLKMALPVVRWLMFNIKKNEH